MNNFKNFKVVNSAKKAMVTIEVVLSVVLSIVVLFLVLGLFNDNIKSMFTASGFNNLVKKDNSSVTANSNFGKNYSNSEVAVQIAGQQGLQWYAAKAQAGIDSIYTLSQASSNPTTALSAGQQIDLAKYFTLKSMLLAWGYPLPDVCATGATTANPWPPTEEKLALDNGINYGYLKGNSILSAGSPLDLESATQPNGDNSINYLDSMLPFQSTLAGSSGNRTSAQETKAANYLIQTMANFDKARAALPATTTVP